MLNALYLCKSYATHARALENSENWNSLGFNVTKARRLWIEIESNCRDQLLHLWWNSWCIQLRNVYSEQTLVFTDIFLMGICHVKNISYSKYFLLNTISTDWLVNKVYSVEWSNKNISRYSNTFLCLLLGYNFSARIRWRVHRK